uniref:Mitochondrial inner membrane protease subunit 2 n=1 Tax=Mus spicilegus TaxID=10103 RepID=A0A8C6GNW7_MUSSI
NVQRFSTSSPIWNVISHLEKRSPKNPEQKIIKRVIALEGDIVRTIGHKNRLVKVPRGHMWVEGDHHGHSFDSNSFGPNVLCSSASIASLIGKLLLSEFPSSFRKRKISTKQLS